AVAAPPGDRSHGRSCRAARSDAGPARALLQEGSGESGAGTGQGQETARQARGPQAPDRRAGDGAGGLVPGASLIAALIVATVLAGAPRSITVSTPHGDQRIPVRSDRGGVPLVSAPLLVAALGGTFTVGETWAQVTLAQQGFRFLLGAPLYLFNDQLEALAAPVLVVHDTVYIPFQFVAEALPTFLGERYRYDRRAARLVEDRGRLLASRPASGRLANGLRTGHIVTVDAGHGGVDPGNPGMFFSHGL